MADEPGAARRSPRRGWCLARAQRPALRRASALVGRRHVTLYPPGVRRCHAGALPAYPTGDDQARRALGAQRATSGLPRYHAQVPGSVAVFIASLDKLVPHVSHWASVLGVEG